MTCLSKSPERVKEYNKKYRIEHTDYFKEYQHAHKEHYKKYRLEHREKHKKYLKKWSPKYYLEHVKAFLKNHPYIVTLRNIRHRCNNKNNRCYKNYGGRGIKCFLSLQDIKFLWERDRAHLLKVPSIDRINNDGNYEIANCRFIEMNDNLMLRHGKIRTCKLCGEKTSSKFNICSKKHKKEYGDIMRFKNKESFIF